MPGVLSKLFCNEQFLSNGQGVETDDLQPTGQLAHVKKRLVGSVARPGKRCCATVS